AKLACGAFSRDGAGNAEAGEAFGIAPDRVYGSYREMAAKEPLRPDCIDFAVVAAPNSQHYDMAKAFLEAGINVACEKPLCFEPRQAEELLSLARRKNLLFATTYAYSGYTMAKVARQMIAGGRIGDILAVSAEFAQEWLLGKLAGAVANGAHGDAGASGGAGANGDAESGGAGGGAGADSAGGAGNAGGAGASGVKTGGASGADGGDGGGAAEETLAGWRDNPAIAGISNCVGDIGTHVEHMVHYMTGLRIRRLLATANTFGQPLELNANVLLEYDNGANGSYWFSQIAAGRQNGMAVRVYGSQGSIEWEQQSPDYLKYTPRGAATQILSRGCPYIAEAAAAGSTIPSGHPEGLYVAFANMYKAYIGALIKKKAGQRLEPGDMDFPDAEDGLSGVKFIHAVIESAASDSRWVSL
ncbi:MAG: Gfo/Idh/MocA family oxidoreductase, partial [Clostridiales bacterium]|nr:Gfo/Idh/MocA family oxidoreductase [Clostridiales bacterium]